MARNTNLSKSTTRTSCFVTYECAVRRARGGYTLPGVKAALEEHFGEEAYERMVADAVKFERAACIITSEVMKQEAADAKAQLAKLGNRKMSELSDDDIQRIGDLKAMLATSPDERLKAVGLDGAVLVTEQVE